MRIETIGFDELEKALEELPFALQREVVLKALRKASQPVLEEARRRVRMRPRRTYTLNMERRTRKGKTKVFQQEFAIGNLRDSLRVDAVGSSKGSDVAVKIGPDRDHYYGLYVEKGTQFRPRVYRKTVAGKGTWTQRNKRAHHATRAYPFLEPALRSRSEEALKILAEELKKAILAKAAELARKSVDGVLSRKQREAVLGELVK